ncbi:hypothetical protein [Clostridium tagluense]|uniref:Bypass of forespore C C-terminal domain-containing protein n=1 Tax=Clostridium tagluense TaxID=360422 RepID=A0A401UJB3_9CLOT|nr:hypothetical protein [Clostridium tagluense]GCD09634.1 hypothetical protein Ctaglu_12570 [Clostridium tagluense]
MKNRKILYAMLTTLLVTFVIASYSLAQYITNHKLELQSSSKIPYLKLTAKGEDSMQASVTSNLPKALENTKFVFKIKYKDCEVRNMVLEKHFNGSTLLNSKTQAQLDEIFKNQGYTVSNMSNSEIVFVSKSDRYSYSANRYFLGVYDNLVTIYKTDNNGDITAHKIFNSNVYAEDGNQKQYDFGAKDSGELQYIKINDLKEKDGLVEDLIYGRKYSKDIVGPQSIEVDQEYESGEFKTPEKAFDYARGLLKS